MKHLSVISALLLFALQLISQVQQEWVARFVNSPFNGYDDPVGVLSDVQGNIYVVGSVWGNHILDDWKYEYVTIKYNPAGIQQWARNYNRDTMQCDIPEDFVLDNSNNIIVTGSSSEYYTSPGDIVLLKYDNDGNLLWDVVYDRSNGWDMPVNLHIDQNNNIFFSCNLYNTGSREDFGLLKYSPAGILQWEKSFNMQDSSYDAPESSWMDQSGNFYITGFTYRYSHGTDMLTVKYNQNGVLQWAKTYNNAFDSSDWGWSVLGDNNGNCYVGGYSIKQVNADIILLKYNLNGVLQWERSYPGPKQLFSFNSGQHPGVYLKLDPANNVILTACTADSLNLYNDIVLLKYNLNGNLIWTRRFDSPDRGTDVSTNMITDESGNVYITGYSWFNSSSIESDFVTLKYSSSGELKWNVFYNGPLNNNGQQDFSVGICKDQNNNIIITGFSTEHSFDIATIKYSQPIGIHPISSEIPDRFSLSQNYPNPFNPVTSIKFDVPSVGQRHAFDVRLVVYDILGREAAVIVNQQLSPGKYQVDFDGSNLPSGVYFYKITAGQFTDTKKMILMK